jgi:hypothetical protein
LKGNQQITQETNEVIKQNLEIAIENNNPEK